jgi:phytol kinase
MVELAASVLGILAFLIVNELWWRRHTMHDEFSRKLVHITVGSFVAFWPFFLSWTEIELLSVAFFLVVGLSKYLNLFQAIHSVQRPTWGELFFALAVGIIALVTHNQWVYMAALLQMSLADGLAAVVGVRFGNSSRYHVFGQDKSVAGTLTFLVVSIVILIGYSLQAPAVSFSIGLIGVAVIATLWENIGILGSDNLLVPLVVAVLLNHLI